MFGRNYYGSSVFGAGRVVTSQTPVPPYTPPETAPTAEGMQATVFEKGGALVGTGRVQWFDEGPPQPANFIENASALILVPGVEVYAAAEVIRDARAAMALRGIVVRADANQSRSVEGMAPVRLTATVRAEASLVVRPDDDEVAMLLALI